MNNDLISRSELKKAIKNLYNETLDGIVKFGIEKAYKEIDNAPTVEPEPVSERQKRALAIVDALTEKRLINVMERGCLRRSILLEPERTQVESISLEDGLKKARRGNYVIYDVDFLLDNLAREVNIMESARQWKAGKGNDNE